MLSAVLLCGPQRLKGMRWSIGRGARKLLQKSLQVILDGNESCLPHATRAHPNKAGSSTCKPTLFETPLCVRRHKWPHIVWACLSILGPFMAILEAQATSFLSFLYGSCLKVLFSRWSVSCAIFRALASHHLGRRIFSISIKLSDRIVSSCAPKDACKAAVSTVLQ